ncbi:MAG: glycoside hydrolase domain-containing protein [Victivallales bacterium]
MKNTLLSAILLSAGLLQAQNLIKNGDFDKPLDQECRFDAAPGVHKTGIFTEDLTWNKCLKLEVARHIADKNGKKYYALVRIGGDRQNNGFPVKPNTVYSFSLELKGEVGASVSAWEWNGPGYWKNVKRIKITGTTSFKASREWTAIRGTFQTGADATHAAIGVSLWGEERWKNLPPVGSFILIDKVKVEEKADLLGGLKNRNSKPLSAPLKKVIAPGKALDGFVDYRSNEKAKADTEVYAETGSGSIKLKIRCLEPEMDKLKCSVSDNGGNVWKDDAVEIFFAPAANDRSLSQFVVAAGGGRWMGRGTDKSVDEYDKWTAEVSREKDAWIINAEIPYELLGWKERPAAGTAIGFNVARNRKPVQELSSLSFANGSFHNLRNFAVLLLDSPEAWFRKTKTELKAEAMPLGNAALNGKLADWNPGSDPAEMIQQAEIFRKEIAAAKLGNRTFVLTQIAPAADPTIPMLPADIANPPEKIAVRAAGNEFKALPLAITNLLDRPEEYRVVIASLDKRGAEEKSLKDRNGNLFPPEKIRLYRGVRVKDGDEKSHGLRFDPLAPMDITSTVIVMPNEATPVWAVFDTAGVAPGRYSGVIRVIPLGQSARLDRSTNTYQGGMRSLPFEFEVLPFELSEAPAIPQFYFGSAYNNRKTFRMMQEYGISVPLINTWGVNVKFNPDGSVKERNTAKLEQEIMNLKQWAKESGTEKDLKIGIAYGAYILFRDIQAKKQFKYGTPEWKKAWREYVLILEDIRKKCGIANEDYFVEIQDEPHAKDMEELILASKIAHETVPTLNLMVTLASWEIPPEELRKLVPYLSHWCFWSTKYFTGKEYAPLLKELREKGKNISFYTCEVTMRLDLQKYYLTHPWRALAYGLDMCNLFQFLTYRYPTDDWKIASYGNTALMASGNPVSTIRLENLRIGNTDIKYMAKLAEVLENSKTEDAGLRTEAEKFLKETPKLVGVDMAHDPAQHVQAREKAIDLILQLMK